MTGIRAERVLSRARLTHRLGSAGAGAPCVARLTERVSRARTMATSPGHTVPIALGRTAVSGAAGEQEAGR